MSMDEWKTKAQLEYDGQCPYCLLPIRDCTCDDEPDYTIPMDEQKDGE